MTPKKRRVLVHDGKAALGATLMKRGGATIGGPYRPLLVRRTRHHMAVARTSLIGLGLGLIGGAGLTEAIWQTTW